jgi:hypothetical protein
MHLRLVPEPRKVQEPEQLQLFSLSQRPNAFIVNTAGIGGADFMQCLEEARPEAVFDLRPVPRFNFGGLTRALVLRRLQERGSVYHDLAGLMGVGSRQDARLNPAFAAEAIARELRTVHPRTILVLFDDARLAELSAQKLPKLLGPGPTGAWRVELLGCKRSVLRP